MAIPVTPDICTPLYKLHFKSYVEDTAPTLHFSLMSGNQYHHTVLNYMATHLKQCDSGITVL